MPAGAAAALVAGIVGLGLALRHPLSPAVAVAGFAIVVALTLRRPGSWLAVLPALLPVMNLSPWTGWLAVDEFDICVCAVVAAGHASRPRQADGGVVVDRRLLMLPVLATLLGTLAVAGLLRGWLDAAPSGSPWRWQGYADPMNSWRVFKSLFYALLLLPLLDDELRRDPALATRRLGIGMLIGLGIVDLAGLWERLAYPGLLDFSESYRTVALFWEMHVGGAAIDAYTALAAPFVGWALWRARSPPGWCFAAMLSLLTAYAALTTFSRGVYLAVTAPLLLVGLSFAWRRHGHGGAVVTPLRQRQPRWRLIGNALLAVALVLEVALVLGSGSFMLNRMAATRHDFGTRLAHWQKGVALLSGPADWLWGIGLGRLPSRYAEAPGIGEFPGALRLVDGASPSNRFLRLSGPATVPDATGLYRLAQRVLIGSGGGGGLRIELQARAAWPTDVEASVCEIHLLYERQCWRARLRIGPNDAGWQVLSADLHGPPLGAGAWYAPRLGMFAVTVVQTGAAVDLRALGLRDASGAELLRNRDFAAAMAHWFPSARVYFLPWHIDNLYLELLIERGLAGLLAFGLLMAWALRSACSVRGEPAVFARIAAAGLGGVLIVGLVSSVMDVPRVAFLVWLLAFVCVLLGRTDNGHESGQNRAAAPTPAANIGR